MKKKLLIVESPAKIKTISKFLDKEFVILSTMGHVKDLPSKKVGVTIDGKDGKTITIDYVVLDKKDKVIADIVKAAKGASEIYLAPDPDREGEIIAWHVAQDIEKVVKNPQIIHRISFNEITKPAIEEALEHPGKINEALVEAQQARRILDRWVGYEVSPILWRKIAKGLSAGRVQSVALKLICDREEAIRTFKPEESWSIEAIFGFKKAKIPATLTHVNNKKVALAKEADAKKVLEQIKSVKDYLISSIKDSLRLKNPLAPFMTSTLQQSAYNQLGFSVDKTMQLAQKLYEGVPLEDANTPIALITYMRTDSTRISDTAMKDVRNFIKSAYGADYLPPKPQLYTKKAAQDAHEAIRPIDVTLSPDKVAHYLEPAMAKLYALIWKRFVACQMKPAQYAQRQVVIEGDGFSFKATGSTLMFDGFLKVYSEPDEEDEGKVKIPEGIAEKNPVALDGIDSKQHFTQPPARFTQASLVKEMEKEGIGRPSTYATILKTIQARAYTELDTKKRFIPTELGFAVTKLLTENLPGIMNIKFTALMEEDLDKIAHGDLDRDTLLLNFYAAFSKHLETFRGEAKRPAEPTDIECPDCKQAKLVMRFGKAGPFLGCPRYPECKFTSNFERLEDGTIKLTTSTEPKLLDEKCPNCEKPLRAMVGRFGPFVACSGYPECKYIQQKKACFPCPLSGGTVIERMWKGKKFWGCSDYPKCNFSISGDIEQKACPQCNNPYLLKKVSKAGTALLCPKKECGYTE
jgi:DNA topoisomerase-1